MKQWNTFAGKDKKAPAKNSGSPDPNNQPAAQSKSMALIKADPEVLFTE